MPFNGSGGFVSLGGATFPAVTGTTILASQYNDQLNDVFSGLGQVITRNGQSPWTANLPAGGFKLTGLAAGSANGDSVAFGQAAITFGAVTANSIITDLGAAGTPSHTFVGDLNTGMYSSGADNLDFATAGVRQVNINATGLVGIGGAASIRRLRLGNNASASEMLRFSSLSADFDIGSTASGLEFTTANGVPFLWTNNAALRMTLAATGMLTIASSAAIANWGASTVAGSFSTYYRGATTTAVGYIGTDGGAIIGGGTGLNFGMRAEADLLLYSAAGTFAAILNASGNFGLGVAAPGTKLDLSDTAARVIDINSTSANGSGVRFKYSGTINGYIGSSKYSISGGALADFAIDASGVNNLILGTNDTERMRLTGAGQALIGTTTVGVAANAGTILSLGNGTATVIQSIRASGGEEFVAGATAGFNFFGSFSNHPLDFRTNNVLVMRLTAAGVIVDANSNELGYKRLPAASVTTGAFVAADSGKLIRATAGVTVPNSTMVAGDVVTIYNTTAGNITITATVGTLTWAGVGTTGNRTLGPKGLCTVTFDTATAGVISGAGLS